MTNRDVGSIQISHYSFDLGTQINIQLKCSITYNNNYKNIFKGHFHYFAQNESGSDSLILELASSDYLRIYSYY
jgi:hypothetical protein